MSIQHRLATPVIQPRMRFFDTDGKPLVGGKVYAFKVGTDEFKPTYRNSELTALNTNPVVLDGAGSALIYLRGANLLKIYDKHGNFIEERIEYQQRERAQFYDDYGRPLKNGYVYTYDYQSTIRKTSYSIDDVINPNPIVLDENGTALVNIVGAYRLRQYNSKNVFVGDQDFKRPPIKALTSVVYPIYFDEDILSSFSIQGVVVQNAQVVSESIHSILSLTGATIRLLHNEYQIEAESIQSSLSLPVAQITKSSAYLTAPMEVSQVSTQISIYRAQITKQFGFLSHTLEPESVKTQLSLVSAVSIEN